MEKSTKIVGGLSSFKEEKKYTKSLLQRIQEAKNQTEINYLLEVAKDYKKASTKTIKMWQNAANIKSQSFSNK